MVLTELFKSTLSIVGGAAMVPAAVSAIPSIDNLVEKGGIWVVFSVLLHWILNILSKKLDRLSEDTTKLTDAVNRLSEKVASNH